MRFAAAALIGVLGPTAASLAATVTSFSPQGEVAVVREVRASFSEPMVRLGESRQADPFDIDCPVRGQGRWADERTWIFGFDGSVPAGTRCRFTLRDDARALAGSAPTGRNRFEFETGGPAVVRAVPEAGSRIDEMQAFVLWLSGAATPESVARNAWCEARGVGERVPVRLLEGPEREELVRRFAARASDVVVLACTRRLPPDSAVDLVWGTGIASPTGLATRKRQVLSYKVRTPFAVAMSCERENASAPCTPLGRVRIEFGAPVERALAEKVRLSFPGGKRSPERIGDDTNVVDGVAFAAPFPENAAFTVELPAAFTDADGRPLSNASAFPMASRTGAFPPLAKFAAAPFGILELEAEPAMPITLRRVERDLGLRGLAPGRSSLRELKVQDDVQVIQWYARLRQFHERTIGDDELRAAFGQPLRKRAADVPEPQVETRSVALLDQVAGTTRVELPAPADAGAAPAREWPFEVVGVPLREPGFYVLELASARLGEALLEKPANMYVRSSALVTNLAVHFKRSAENAVVWVTTLDKGRAVRDAQVRVSDCRGKALWEGRTDVAGLARIDVPLADNPDDCDEHRPGYFVSARLTDAKGRSDFSFAWSGWDQGIERWRFDVPTDVSPEAAVRAHTVLDRNLLRAGETVSMKHLVRLARAGGLRRPADGDLPPRMTVVHQGSEQTWSVPLRWQSAAADAVFRLPRQAKLGTYDVYLDYGEAPAAADGRPAPRRSSLWNGRLQSGSFRVEAFRLPMFEARVAPPAGVQVAPAELPLDVSVSWLSGGPAAALPVKLSAMLQPWTPQFDGFDGYTFERDDLMRADDDGRDAAGAAQARGVHRDRLLVDAQALALDARGAARPVVPSLPALAVPHRLVAEASFADPNGETQTVTGRTVLWPAALAVGLKTQGWASAGRRFALQAVVLDTAGKPQPSTAVKVQARLEKTVSFRKRLVGGFYAYDNQRSVRELGVVCEGKTDAHGLLNCTIEPKLEAGETGNLLMIAEAPDAQGRRASASTSVWLTGRGELWFDAENQDRMDVIPERRRYMPGETARLQVRMPFRWANALVAVEREGIVDTRLVELRGSDPVIELPVRAEWGPNVYVSVLAVRGRLRDVPWYSFFSWGWRAPVDWYREWRSQGEVPAAQLAPTATVDLARPAFKLGLAEIGVGIDGMRLQVGVTTDKADYPVRGTAKVSVQVRLPGGAPVPAGTEVELAAVDEALLELAPNTSWKLLESMMQRRSHGVDTATAQMQVVGKRHFGRKAVPAGGDGGRNPTRELFDTLLYWNPRVSLDANGRADVEVRLNDSLSRFRIVAVADAGDGFFGTGEASIRSAQDLQLVSGLPPLVRDGDVLSLPLTVRNATSRTMKVAVRAAAVARTADRRDVATIGPFDHAVDLAAGGSTVVELPVTVPAGADTLEWDIESSESGGARDRLAVRQQIAAAVPLTVRQASLQRLDGPLDLPLATPADALAGRSVMRVGVSASIAGSLAGVRDWLQRYPYGCLEQKSSKAIGIGDAAAWSAIGEELPSYLDEDGLAAYFPPREGAAAAGSDTLTAWLLAISKDAGLALPAPARDRMLEALARFVEGRIRRDSWAPRPDLAVRRLAALATLTRYGRATVRMASALDPDPNRLPTSAVIDWLQVLDALPALPQRDARRAAAEQVLRARLSYAATRLQFTSEDDDRWWWLMASGDANAARLLLAVLERPAWKDDVPRLLGGLLARQRNGAWTTTTANAWGAVAVRRFAQRFESETVAGNTRAAIVPPGQAAGAGPGAGAVAFDWTAPSVDWTLAMPDGASTLRMSHAGSGAPWVTVQALAAVPLRAALANGFRVTRTMTPVQRRDPAALSRGDVVRVRVEIVADTQMTWVVLDDPVPAGAAVLGAGLGRDSAISTRDERSEGLRPDWEERGFGGVRAYWSLLPAGRVVYEYTLRLNQAGEARLPPTRVEAMYAPEVFGESPNASLRIVP